MAKLRLVLALAASLAFGASAQVATDGTLGARVTLTGQNIAIASALGRYVNGNLFHSFQTFNVATGQVVTFLPSQAMLGAPVASSIIGRVTGGTASVIQGTVRSATPGVNLYLVNPGGIVFGQGALVDVNGSFYASSAHYVRSTDGTRFESRGPGISLTFTAPDGFGFESAGAPLAVQGAILRVREGSTLGLVGGGLLVGGIASPTLLQALGGNAVLVATGSPGVVASDTAGTRLEGFGTLGDVLIQRGATVTAVEGAGRTGGGSIFVRGAHVVIDQATLNTRTTFGNGRGIDLGAARDLSIRQSNVLSVTTGAGNAGTIRLSGANVTLEGGVLVDTSCDPGCTTGRGGALVVRAADTFHMNGTATNTYLVSNSFGGGATGEIDIAAPNVILEGLASIQGVPHQGGDGTLVHISGARIVLDDGAQVLVSSRGTGRGGRIVVDSTGSMLIRGTRIDPSQNNLLLPSGLFSNAEASGNAGAIVVSTRTLDILAGGEISSSTGLNSTGAGGNVSVTASEAIRIAGAGRLKPSGIASNAFGTGDAGSIDLKAPTIALSNFGSVQSDNRASVGGGGVVRIEANDLTLAGGSQVSSVAFDRGAAGRIFVSLSGTLAISGEASGILTVGLFRGAGGDIRVDAGRIWMDAGFITATTIGPGDAGGIVLRARESFSLSGRSLIESRTSASGAAGSIDVEAGSIALSGEATISTRSDRGTGNAGRVRLLAHEWLDLAGHAKVTSATTGPGLAGNLDIRSEGSLRMTGGAEITTSGLFSDGGDIRVSANGLAFLQDARVTTEVGSGLGGGGNVTIDVPTLVMQRSVISANAFGGPGGNIQVHAPILFKSPSSAITASSQLGIEGTVSLESPAIDPSGQLIAALPSFLDAGAVLAGRCGARYAGRASSLVIAPRPGDELSAESLRWLAETSVLRRLAGPEAGCPAPPEAREPRRGS